MMTLAEILCKYTWKWAAGGGAEGAQARGVAVERAHTGAMARVVTSGDKHVRALGVLPADWGTTAFAPSA